MVPTNNTEITDNSSNHYQTDTHSSKTKPNSNSFHMLPLLIKKTSTLLISSIPSFSTPPIVARRIVMDSWAGKNNGSCSQRLLALAQQLRFYSPPVNNEDDDVEEEMGIAESVAPVVGQERFRPKRAAVLVCLFEGDDGELRVFLTKRSDKLSTHSGEVSLPGGKADELDANDAETATREAKEEIGLDPSLVNVVTCLEPFLSKHLLRVIPVIGILVNKEEFSPCPNAAEVEAVFHAPLEMFLKDENRRSEEREWLGNKYLIHFFDYEMKDKKYVIWGLTAGILIRAASVVYQKPPAFVEQNPKFKLPTVVRQDTTMP